MRPTRRIFQFLPLLIIVILTISFFAQTALGEENTSPTPTSESSSGSGSGSGSGGSGSGVSSSSSPTLTPTLTPTPFSTPTPTLSFENNDSSEIQFSTQTEELDRFAQVDENTLNCIKTRLNDYEFERLRRLIPKTEEEYKELENLKDKASICFESYSEVKEIEEAGKEVQEMSGKVQECLLERIGQKAFDEISLGQRPPTNDERKNGEICFESEEKPKVVYQLEEQELEDNVKSCLALALGDRRYRDIGSSRSNLSLSEREKVGRCFGVSPHPLAARPTYKIPDEIFFCLQGKLGGEAFEEIAAGKRVPTDNETVSGRGCFANLNKTQIRFLPNPPEQVPYLSEKPDLIEVQEVSEGEDVVSENVFNRKIVLKGSGIPKSLIDIYIFSEPIVVTTESDENGDWIYEMNYPLEAGEHVAYATVRTKDGSSVRSSVFDFQVLAAEDNRQDFLRESSATRIPSRFLSYAIALIGLSLLTALLGLFYLFHNFKRNGNVDPPSGLS